jgi:uncharacterized DUF497 family protein
MALEFEWDPAKAATNLRKHGVAFDEATTVFADPSRVRSATERTRWMRSGW